MKTNLSKCLLITAVPLLLYFALYRGIVYFFLSNWSYKDWGYLVLFIATISRTIRLFALRSTTDYLKLVRLRTLGYDIAGIILGPVIFLPVIGFVLVIQPEFELMLASYCIIVVITDLLLQYLWAKEVTS